MRTTCKQCGAPLPKCHINAYYGWCNKHCRRKWIERHNKKWQKMKKRQKNAYYGCGGAFDYEGNSV